MSNFFNDYFNIRKMIEEKKKYRQHLKRMKALPADYQYVYEKIQSYMWRFVSGAGYDMLEIQYGLLDLFEESVEAGKKVLEVTGEDVASFVEELLKNTKTYTEDWKSKLNQDILKTIGNGGK